MVIPKLTTLESEVADIKTQVTAFYFSLKPVSTTCPGTEAEGIWAYGSGLLDIPVKPNCNYNLNLAIGVGEPDDSTLRLAGTPTYTGEIKALVDQYCVSCHKPDGSRANSPMESYTNTSKWASSSLTKITDGSMPPSGALSADEQALFKAWVDGGKLQSPATDAGEETDTGGDTAAGGGTAAGGKNNLTKTFYQNAEPLRLTPADFRDAEALAVSLALKLQDDGKAIGLSTATLGVDKITPTTLKDGKVVNPDSGGDDGGTGSTAGLTYGSAMKSIIDSKCATAGCHAPSATFPDLSVYSTTANYDQSVTRILDATAPMPPNSATPLTADEKTKWQDWKAAGYPQ